jgi:thiol-disulfide isomerase/thioredoxin
MSTVKPREVTPSLDVDTLDGGRFTLGEQNPEAFTMVVFYRGLHCPVCRKYLGELDRLYDDFRDQGVENVQIGYGLEIEKMREWGFLVSRGEGSEEPQLYGEPGLFLIRADEIVYYQAINSMPFGRPELQEMLTAIGNVKKMDIPAHGEA